MEDAIDDWLLRQIQWLQKDETIVQGIRMLQDILWPGGIFFLTLRSQSKQSDKQASQGPQTISPPGGKMVNQSTSFEQQLEAARRASNVKNFIFNGAPAALVSLTGPKQYKRGARDIYHFIQPDSASIQPTHLSTWSFTPFIIPARNFHQETELYKFVNQAMETASSTTVPAAASVGPNSQYMNGWDSFGVLKVQIIPVLVLVEVAVGFVPPD